MVFHTISQSDNDSDPATQSRIFFLGVRAYEKVNGETIYGHGNIFLTPMKSLIASLIIDFITKRLKFIAA